MILLYTFAAFIFMYFYWKKSTQWRNRKHSHTAQFFEHDISLHTVMIENIPTTIPTKELNDMLEDYFTTLLRTDENISQVKLVQCRAAP